jgi:prepilin-type N-terminal cleavage/methylation domain-containing protein
MAGRTGNRDGFSLLEMMVGCVVIGVVLAASVPNLRSYRESHRIWSESQQIASICKAAQARARSEDHNIIVEYHPDDNEYLVIDDENNNGQADGGEGITTHPVRDGLSLSSTTFTDNRLVFDARGRATTGGTILIQGDRSDIMPKRVVVAAGTGQVRIRGGFEP